MFLGSIWNNPYLVRERQSARTRRLLVLTVIGVSLLAALAGLATVLAARGAQSPSQPFWVRVSADHWLHRVNGAQAFARGMVGAATFAIWLLGSGIAPVYAAARRYGEVVSGQADHVGITRLTPSEVTTGSILSSLFWILGAMGAALPLLVLGHLLANDPVFATGNTLLVATLVVGAIARGAVGFVGAQKYAGKGASIVFACAIGWIAIPFVVLVVWLLTALAATDGLQRAVAQGTPARHAEIALSYLMRSFGLAATSVIALLAFAWALRSSEARGGPEPEAERPKVVFEGPRFDIERGPSLWKMGKTDFERIIFEPKARKAADLPPDTEAED